jgi:hypothetical protein
MCEPAYPGHCIVTDLGVPLCQTSQARQHLELENRRIVKRGRI